MNENVDKNLRVDLKFFTTSDPNFRLEFTVKPPVYQSQGERERKIGNYPK